MFRPNSRTRFPMPCPRRASNTYSHRAKPSAKSYALTQEHALNAQHSQQLCAIMCVWVWVCCKKQYARLAAQARYGLEGRTHSLSSLEHKSRKHLATRPMFNHTLFYTALDPI